MRVFIIDDDTMSLFLTENLLLREDNKLDITTFLSATDALEAIGADNVSPDVIFLDLNMPAMDGWEFLDSMAPLNATLKGICNIYILTSSLDPNDSEKARKYPLVKRLINKPLGAMEIKDILSHPKEIL